MKLPRPIVWVFRPTFWAATMGGVLLLLYAASLAWGACMSIPTRYDALCETFGAQPNCQLINEPGRGGQVWLTVAVNDHVGEFRQVQETPFYVTTVSALLPRRRTVSMTYRNATDPTIPPCFFATCIQYGYPGPTEADLLNPIALTKFEFRALEGDLATQLQAAYRATGIPYIDRAYPLGAKIDDQTLTTLSTTFTMRVRVRFLIGAQ
jgi:hypothetical protein